MFVRQSTHEQACLESQYFRTVARELQAKNRDLREEIADRHRSETDAREQLRALLSKQPVRGAGGRFAKAV